MNKLILSIAAITMTLGLGTVTTSASAKDRYPQMLAATDTNKDGMVSRDEFLLAMGAMYDQKMVKMKTMSTASQAKMMKDSQMTIDGYRALLGEISGGQ